MDKLKAEVQAMEDSIAQGDMSAAQVLLQMKHLAEAANAQAKRDLESQLVVGARVKIGPAYAAAHPNCKAGDIITLVRGEFEHENGLYTEHVSVPSIWDSDSREFDSIYHLFENDLSGFMDCEILPPPMAVALPAGFRAWLDAVVTVANATGMDHDEVIRTWPHYTDDDRKMFANHPELRVGDVMELDALLAGAGTEPPAPDAEGEAVMEFGNGNVIVQVGAYGDKPAVFITPAEPPGVAGELAPPTTGEDKHRMLPGERVMTFPTEAQAHDVAEKLCGRRLKRLDGGSVPAPQVAVPDLPSQVTDAGYGWLQIAAGEVPADRAPVMLRAIAMHMLAGGAATASTQEQPSSNPCQLGDRVLMPKALNAENSAKTALMGEFTFSVTMTCPQCHPDEPNPDCEVCAGSVEYEQPQTVPWTTIKKIYAAAVELLGVPALDEREAWYSAQEMYDFLIRRDYSAQIASELSELWADSLNAARQRALTENATDEREIAARAILDAVDHAHAETAVNRGVGAISESLVLRYAWSLLSDEDVLDVGGALRDRLRAGAGGGR